MKTVDEICGTHLGQTLKVESADGATIIGSLHSVEHKVKTAWGTTRETVLTFEELRVHPVGRASEYIIIQTYGNRSAELVEDE